MLGGTHENRQFTYNTLITSHRFLKGKIKLHYSASLLFMFCFVTNLPRPGVDLRFQKLLSIPPIANAKNIYR